MPKSTRGGRRPGAGRPATTASSATRPVSFRLGAEDHDRAAAIARDCGVSIGVLARDAFIAAIDAAPGAEPTKGYWSDEAVAADAEAAISDALAEPTKEGER